MSKWLKLFLFGIWGVLLIPPIAGFLEVWLLENFLSETNAATISFSDATTTSFKNLVALGQQRWFKFALVLLTGVVIGASLEWLTRKSGRKKAYELRSLGFKFSSLSDSIKIRTASSEWPSNVHDLRPAILSAFISAKKFDLWVPSNRIYEMADASFLCEYFRCVGRLLEDGYFVEANREALSWKPFLDRAKVS